MDKDKLANEFLAMVEFVRSGTPSQIQAYIDRQRNKIQNLRERIRHNPSQEDKSTAYVNLLTYVDRQTYMLGRFRDEPIECTAWITRNLYELNLFVQYLGDDEQKAETFIKGQFARDELQILRGFNGLSLSNLDETVVPSRKNIDFRIQQIKDLLDKSNSKEKGPIPTGTLADLAGDRNAYDALYNFYSKYVHPSPWIINAAREQVDTQEHRTMFFVEAVMNAAKIVAQAATVFNLDY
jgi:hypothetical protein